MPVSKLTPTRYHFYFRDDDNTRYFFEYDVNTDEPELLSEHNHLVPDSVFENVRSFCDNLRADLSKVFDEYEEQPIAQAFIFGRDAVREIEKGKTPDQVSELIEKNECLGLVIDKTFPNKDVQRAYLEGIDDADGWDKSTWVQTS